LSSDCDRLSIQSHLPSRTGSRVLIPQPEGATRRRDRNRLIMGCNVSMVYNYILLKSHHSMLPYVKTGTFFCTYIVSILQHMLVANFYRNQ